jgi:4-hydroxythreonine-4-phosphate dehydrogenase
MEKIKIGISIGDMNGIGLEIILKTLDEKRVRDKFLPIIYGSSKVVAYHKNMISMDDFNFAGIRPGETFRKNQINVINCWQEDTQIEIGAVTEQGGRFAGLSLDQATKDLKEGIIDALVTAPIHKKAMQLSGFRFPGHTEFLTHAFDTKESLMLMCSENLKVGLVTNHVPVSEVAPLITRERLKNKLSIFNRTLKIDFGIERPSIAVLGLNPHAGDNGVIGEEEEKIITPLIIEAKKQGIGAMGPYPADGFFGNGTYRKFDGVLAMYHDQGLVPFKALSFGNGINFTAGLEGIRTSPDHGTAHDIAGKGIANPSSFRNAVFLALDIARQRKSYYEMHQNPVKKSKQHSERSGKKSK